MPVQVANWSCSACALAWVQRATLVKADATEATAIAEIGYPQNINPTYGLMDGSGIQLEAVLGDYGLPTEQTWLTFDSTYAIAEQTCGLMSGGAWYHWVAIRGISGSSLWIANSAPGYMGIYDTLTRAQFNSLGPFSVVWLEQ